MYSMYFEIIWFEVYSGPQETILDIHTRQGAAT